MGNGCCNLLTRLGKDDPNQDGVGKDQNQMRNLNTGMYKYEIIRILFCQYLCFRTSLNPDIMCWELLQINEKPFDNKWNIRFRNECN